jgi:hypothetical protein
MGDPAPVLEVLNLLLSRSDQDNIASSMQALHDMQIWAEQYMKDPTTEDPVWLHAKMANETGERRALVHRIEIQYGASWYGDEATAEDLPLTITVLRGPYWESTSVRNLPDAAPSAAACVAYDYTAAGDVVAAHDIVGDGARLRYFDVFDNGSDQTGRFWMGIRSANKHGATGISNFEPIWECEDGTNGTDATDTVDSTASGGYNVTVSESGVDWDDGSFHVVLTHTLTNATTNEEDQLGNFLWLLRTKVASGTWEIRFNFPYGASNPRNYYSSPIKEITSTNWEYYEMCVLPIGLRNIHAITDSDFSKSNIGAYSLEIVARRTSGSGDFYVDCVIPLPIDEGMVKFQSDETLALAHHSIGQSPEGIYDGLKHKSSAVEEKIEILSINNFVLPPGDGRIYCVYAKAGGTSDIADVITFNDGDIGRYYERWLSLRGSE